MDVLPLETLSFVVVSSMPLDVVEAAQALLTSSVANRGQHGSYRGSLGRKTEKLDLRLKKQILLHMAIQGVLTRQDGAEKYCASNWTPCFIESVIPNTGFH